MTLRVYQSDLTDEQWSLVSPVLPLAKSGGRPRKTDMRQVLNGLMYLATTGCHWRQLPKDFPHWRTVYGYFAEWCKTCVLRKLQRVLYFRVRKAAGRSKYPSIVIIDSQSVRTTKMGGVRGYDGGKHVKGRKRHIVVDSLGFPVGFSVTAANTHDLKGARKVLPQVRKFLLRPSFKKLYGDGSYKAKAFKVWVKDKYNAVVITTKNLATRLKKFVPVSQRWVVERSFSWLYDCRRLLVDHERTLRHSRGMIRLAAVRLMLNRLAPTEDAPKWNSAERGSTERCPSRQTFGWDKWTAPEWCSPEWRSSKWGFSER